MRQDLCAEAIRLCELLLQLVERERKNAMLHLFRPELMGLLALMLLHDARRQTRADAAGQIVLLEAQDRGLWDRAQIARGQHCWKARCCCTSLGPTKFRRPSARFMPRPDAPKTQTGRRLRRCTKSW